MLPLSLSSFASTLLIGPLFDKIGRRELLLVTCNNFLSFRWCIRYFTDVVSIYREFDMAIRNQYLNKKRTSLIEK
jgi:hypothetical protein